MKTAYELAMERLRKQDHEAGIETRTVTDEQKAEIAEVRRVYKARIAQEEVMFASKLRNSGGSRRARHFTASASPRT